ncbi:MAG: DMT family transporter [Proteobacteria bacterium]|nr:DMT family transporter [Pseudomonadota bacterium]MDA1059916.1 DMT family transporter [Pseudomonadota bacterium]
MTDTDRTAMTGQLQIWGATALIATSFPVGEAIARGLDPAVLTLLRFVVAAVLFTPIIAWRYGLSWPGWRALGGYAAISLCMTGFFWSMFEALRHTTALNTGTIFVLIPSLAALYSFLLLGDRLGRYRLTALGLGMVGAVWVIFRGDLDRLLGLQFNRGDLIFLAGCFVMAAYGPLVKKLHRQEPPAIIAFWSVLTGCVWLALFSNVKLVTTNWAAIDTGVIVGIVYLAVFTTILSTFLFQAATIKLGPNRVAAFYYINPLLVVLIDWIVGKGLPPLRVLPGVAIALAATFVLQQAARQKPAAAPQPPEA